MTDHPFGSTLDWILFVNGGTYSASLEALVEPLASAQEKEHE